MIVLDASAVLAYLKDEPGAAVVESALAHGDAVCSAASWSEIAQKVGTAAWPDVAALLDTLGLQVRPVSRGDAEAAARLWQPGVGLSLADRLCLALGAALDADVLTADGAWVGRSRVRLIR